MKERPRPRCSRSSIRRWRLYDRERDQAYSHNSRRKSQEKKWGEDGVLTDLQLDKKNNNSIVLRKYEKRDLKRPEQPFEAGY